MLKEKCYTAVSLNLKAIFLWKTQDRNSCDRKRFKSNMDGGGGDSFDPCECICSHEGAMRRLISLVNINSIYI